MRNTFVALVSLLVLAACATAPQPVLIEQDEETWEEKSDTAFYLAQSYLALHEGNAALALHNFEKLERLGRVPPEIARIQAYLLINTGEIDRAVQVLDKCLAEDPDNIELLEMKAGALAAAKRHREALAVYSHIHELRPHEQLTTVIVSNIHEELEEIEEAIRILEEFVGAHPTAALALFELGRIYINVDRPADAKSAFRRVTELQTENVKAWIGLSLACEDLGEHQEAIAALERAVNLDPGDPALRRELINLHLRANNPDAALEETKSLELLGSGAEENAITKAIVLYHQGQTEEAISELFLVLSNNPENNQARFLQGIFLIRLNRSEAAIEELRLIPADSTYYLDARLAIASQLEHLQRYPEAIDELDKLEKAYPAETDLIDILRTRGSLLTSMGRYDEAEAVLQRALAIDPEGEQLLHALAMLYEETGRWRESIQMMEKRLAQNPDDVDALNFIGYTLADHDHDLERAEQLLAKAVKLKPYSGHIVDSYGWVLYRLGRHEDALVHLKRAFELEPSEAVIAEHIGDVYAAQGNREQARDYWETGLQLNPNPKTATRLKEKLSAL